MVAAGDRSGNVFVFQIPKEPPEELRNLGAIAGTALNKSVQRYSVREKHLGPVKSIEWSKNGMKLFSGDKAGVIVLTEFDFIKVGAEVTLIVIDF